MSVKKIFTWIYLLCKHILKMPVIFILLLIIPAVTLTFRLLPAVLPRRAYTQASILKAMMTRQQYS